MVGVHSRSAEPSMDLYKDDSVRKGCQGLETRAKAKLTKSFKDAAVLIKFSYPLHAGIIF